jgi:hypothetical protein
LDQFRATAPVHVTLSDPSRLPVEQLARLLLEHPANDRGLLHRLHVKAAQRTARPEHAQNIGGSPAMRHAAELIRRFARTDDPVLITEESGTGKELAAQAMIDGRSKGHADRPLWIRSGICRRLAASSMIPVLTWMAKAAQALCQGHLCQNIQDRNATRPPRLIRLENASTTSPCRRARRRSRASDNVPLPMGIALGSRSWWVETMPGTWRERATGPASIVITALPCV